MRTRLYILSTLLIIATFTVGARLFYLQIIHGKEYRAKADAQFIRPVEGIFRRGNIYFTEKDGKLVLAAGLKDTFIIVANLRLVEDIDVVYEKISRIIPLDRANFFANVSDKSDPHVIVAKGVSAQDSAVIRSLQIKGILVQRSATRDYPGSSLASHVLGFVGEKRESSGVLEGRYGIEHAYEAALRQDPLKVSAFILELLSNLGSGKDAYADHEGDVILTIEPKVQAQLETELSLAMDKWKAEKAVGIVMDPRDGKIISLAVTPSFDPNYFFRESSIDIFSNVAVENLYEMGSIVKPLTLAAAIDDGAITKDTTFIDKGYTIVRGVRIENAGNTALGKVDMQKVLDSSLNSGAIFVGQQLGKEKFKKYFMRYGFEEKTGIDLPGETRNNISNLSKDRDVDYATATFGQGISMTPIGMTRALAVLANGGFLIKPYLVQEITRGIGAEKPIERNQPIRILKESTSRTMSDMLTHVVDYALAQKRAKIEHYSIAAKTGTAQVAGKVGGYISDRFTHTFFGYLPASNPMFIMFFLLENPKGVTFASQSLVDTFVSMNNFLIHYYRIPPDR